MDMCEIMFLRMQQGAKDESGGNEKQGHTMENKFAVPFLNSLVTHH